MTSELDNLRATEVVAKIDADYQDDSNNDDDVDDNHNKIGNDNSSHENHNGTNNEDDNNYNGLGDNDKNNNEDEDDLDQVEMRKKEMRKIAELKDSYLDCRRRAGSEEAYIARFRL